MNQEFAVQSRLNVKQADNFYNPQFFMADGDEYLITVPPIRYVRPLFFNADDTPGPMYGVQQNFLCLTEGNDYGFFNITPVDPLDTYNRSSKDGTFGVVHLPDEGSTPISCRSSRTDVWIWVCLRGSLTVPPTRGSLFTGKTRNRLASICGAGSCIRAHSSLGIPERMRH